jgi:predicted RNA-binding protein with PUA-like domain
MTHKYWLFKTEPSTYSFKQLEKDRKTNWNGVRNFQARNFLKQVALGDQALIYHSGDDKAVVGIAEVIRSGYPDLDPEMPGEWVQIDLKFKEAFSHPVTLKEMKAHPALTDLLLIKQSRLSCMSVAASDFKLICKLGQPKAAQR